MDQTGKDKSNIDAHDKAVSILKDTSLSEHTREEAIDYLKRNPTAESIELLVLTLEDDDEGVRWAAGGALAELGDAAWAPLLKALTEPGQSVRLRRGARHVLNYTTSPRVRSQSAELLRALKGQESALSTEIVAHKLLRQLE
jgi:HEAT repeat protein